MAQPPSYLPVWVVWAWVCMALAVAAAVLWTALWQRQALQHSLWQAHSQQQQAVADTWGRLLTVRLDAQQRTVAALAETLPPDPEEQTTTVQAWLAQGGGLLRWLDTLHVVHAAGAVRTFQVGPPSSPSADAASGALGAAEWGTVQAALADGKPRMGSQPSMGASAGAGGGVQVLLVVPLPRSHGTPSSALAARVYWSEVWLLPQQPQAPSALAFQLLDPMGHVLAQSQGATPAQAQALQVLAQHGQEWRNWLRTSTGSAKVQQWGPWLLARAPLPQAQWEVLVVGALPALPWHEAAPWLTLGLGWALVLALAAAGIGWGWQRWGRPPLGAAPAARHSGGPLGGAPVLGLSPTELADGALPTYGRAMLDMAPVPLLAVHGETVRLCNVHVQLLLGYSTAELEGQHVSVLFADVPALLHAERQVRDQIHHTGSYSGALRLRRRDGSTLVVQLQAQWLPSDGPYTVWRVHPPAAVWRRSVWQAPEVAPGLDERDALTGLHNRMALGWLLQAWAGKAVPAGASQAATPTWAQLPASGCLLVLDVDHLGALNEVASRSFGDSVLTYVAQLLQWQLRSIGWVARLGGDEFVAVLPGLSLAHAQTVGQRLCSAVQQWRPLWREEPYAVSISVGVVAVDVLRHDMQQALRAADLACYEAKRRGRGQVAAGQVGNAEVLRTHSMG